MNLLDKLTRGVGRAGESQPPPAWSNVAVRGLVGLSPGTVILSARLAGNVLSMLMSILAHSHRLGDCAECGAPVSDSDPFIRYRGEYYHAHDCVERNPPATRRRDILAAPR
jgi:hypothetical protein